MNTLRFDDSQFYLNDQRFRILSGTIHYFRVVPDYWEDRLLKLKQCGFNTPVGIFMNRARANLIFLEFWIWHVFLKRPPA